MTNFNHPLIIYGLQYSNWSETIFRQMNQGGVSAVQVTICYHEDFNEMVENIIAWNSLFNQYSDLIFHGLTSDDVLKGSEEGRTAIIFGFHPFRSISKFNYLYIRYLIYLNEQYNVVFFFILQKMNTHFLN